MIDVYQGSIAGYAVMVAETTISSAVITALTPNNQTISITVQIKVVPRN